MVSLVTSFLAPEITIRLVGRPTMKLIMNPPINLMKKPESRPVIIRVMVRVIVKSMANVMNVASRSVEYFLFIFKVSALIEGYKS